MGRDEGLLFRIVEKKSYETGLPEVIQKGEASDSRLTGAAGPRETRPMRTISRDFRTLFGAGALGGLTDGQLLDRFLARREEAAFEEIVRRHGTMVWGVCRRILRRHHDAEDAFQATFLVLARKGASVFPRERLGNWLYGVAVQTALKARSLIAKRGERERQVMTMPEPTTDRLELPDDLGIWLDRELSRLPEKYRAPIVLCDLEGESHKAAACRLGWPIGTLSGRLSRARAILARRLNRRGQGLSAGALALVLAREAESASLPPLLSHSTARAAACLAAGGAVTELVSAQVAALMEGVVTAMVLTQVRVVAAGLLMAGLVGLCLGMPAETAGALESQAKPGGAESRGDEKPGPAEKKPASPKSDLELLQGTWFGAVVEVGGKPLETDAAKLLPWIKIIVNGERVFLRGPKFAKTVSLGTLEDTELAIKLDLVDNQRQIDLTCLPVLAGERSLTYHGIYSFSKDRFEICLSVPGESRPRAFKTRPQSSQLLIVLRPAIMQLEPEGRIESIPRRIPSSINKTLMSRLKLNDPGPSSIKVINRTPKSRLKPNGQ